MLLDTRVNLAPKRQLNLVQVNTVADHVVIFDDQTTPAITTTDCRLQKLLESEQIIKVNTSRSNIVQHKWSQIENIG